MADLGPFEYFICGGVGGTFAVLLGHPFDTVKVKLQTMPKPPPGVEPLYAGMVDCMKKTLQTQGLSGLYKGMTVPLVTLSPVFAMSFMGFKLGKQIIGPADQAKCTYTDFCLAGAISGIFSTIITTPSERIKCLMQIQDSKKEKYIGPVGTAIKLYKTGGLRSIYKGTIATLIRDIPGNAGFYLSYEAVKSYLTDNGRNSISLSGTVIAGGSAGMSNWIISMPSDVIKSRIQTSPRKRYPNGVRDVIRELYKEDGVFAFYKGMMPAALRAFPANAACFLGFELTKIAIRRVFPS